MKNNILQAGCGHYFGSIYIYLGNMYLLVELIISY